MGGIRRREVEGEVAAEVVVAVIWFIGCGRSARGCWDRTRPFLFSYIELER